LDSIGKGCQVGKLFAPHHERRVRDQHWFESHLNRVDRLGRPLISVDTPDKVQTEIIDGRLIARIPLLPGCVTPDASYYGLFPTVGKALESSRNIKHLLRLHQVLNHTSSRIARPLEALMVRTVPFVFRNCYARVVPELLPKGLKCFSSNLIENSHKGDDSRGDEGRTLCFYGESMDELTTVPVEFFTMEAWRDYSKLSGGTLLKRLDEEPDALLRAVGTMPSGGLSEWQASVYVVKADFLDRMTTDDWVVTNPQKYNLEQTHNLGTSETKAQQLRKFSHQQSSYAILKAISTGDINSQGVLLTRYFPSTTLKHILMADFVSSAIKRIYFVKASRSEGDFFSQGDRNMLLDLTDFGIEVYCVDPSIKKIFKFTAWQGRDCGLFVPPDRQKHYLQATFLGVYGSNLTAGSQDEVELRLLVQGLKDMREDMDHALIRPGKPLALVTGGGPGAMEIGNRVAKECGILSCGCVVDFSPKDKKSVVNEQKRNPHVEAWMTYRLEKLVERQSEFNLDLPIFLTGGVGTDFEMALEEVRRKVGTQVATPMLLIGPEELFRAKIAPKFMANKKAGTNKGSEWLSNCFYVLQTAQQALKVYRLYFSGKLITGKLGKTYDDGFCVVPKDGPELEQWEG